MHALAKLLQARTRVIGMSEHVSSPVRKGAHLFQKVRARQVATFLKVPPLHFRHGQLTGVDFAPQGSVRGCEW